MTRKEIQDGNELIADFLDWQPYYKTYYKVPDELMINDEREFSIDEFSFNDEWNPILRKQLTKLVNKMKNSLMYGHIGGAYENLINLIKWYNNQLT